MDTEKLVVELNNIFWNRNFNDDETANQILNLLDENQYIIEFDSALRTAYRELNIWSRTETDTGSYLDRVANILSLLEA